MKQKTFAGIILLCVFVPALVFGSFQYGVSVGNSTGYSEGFDRGQASNTMSNSHAYSLGNETGFSEGYQAGLKAAQSGVTPFP